MIKGFKSVVATSPYGAREIFLGVALHVKQGNSGFHNIVELSIEQNSGPPIVGVVPDSWCLCCEFNQ